MVLGGFALAVQAQAIPLYSHTFLPSVHRLSMWVLKMSILPLNSTKMGDLRTHFLKKIFRQAKIKGAELSPACPPPTTTTLYLCLLVCLQDSQNVRSRKRVWISSRRDIGRAPSRKQLISGDQDSCIARIAIN